MTERKVKLDRANKSILLRALGDVYYGQRANGGSTEVTGRLILRVNDLPAGGRDLLQFCWAIRSTGVWRSGAYPG